MTLQQSIHDGVMTLQLHRPEKKNALSLALYHDLAQALEEAAQDSTVRVVLLTGGADCFTSGNDLGDFLQQPDLQADHPAVRFMQALMGCPKPVVAAVAELAIGIGTTLLLHCDLILATPQTRFQMPFVPLGLVPEFGASHLLPAQVGRARANQWLLLGEPFSAEQALAAGLINWIVPQEQLQEQAQAVAQRLAALPAQAVRHSKRLLTQHREEALPRHIERELAHFREALAGPEFQQAAEAFFQRARTPETNR